jgi:hypothetical protein
VPPRAPRPMRALGERLDPTIWDRRGPGSAVQFFATDDEIHSDVISGPAPLGITEHGHLNEFASVNGLIHLDHGSRLPSGNRDETCFAFTRLIVNVTTGEQRENTEYAKAFAALRKAAKKLATERTRTSGVGKGWPMTKRALHDALHGHPYKHRPAFIAEQEDLRAQSAAARRDE